MAKDKEITWRELKEFVNKLPEILLDDEVIYWGEEKGGTVNSLMCLEEDYTNVSDEYWEPVSVYKGDKDYEDDIPDSPLLPKGTPIIYID